MSTKMLASAALAALIGLGVSPATGQDDPARTEEARRLAGTMMQALGGKLQAAMKEGGPAAVIGVCTTAAPAIAGEPSGRYFRYVKALPVQPVCMNCHGDAANLAPDIKDRLTREYPADRATGYSVGQIRGAVSVKRPL